MREYRTESYKKKLAGNKFFSSDSDLKKYDGMRVEKVIKELSYHHIFLDRYLN